MGTTVAISVFHGVGDDPDRTIVRCEASLELVVFNLSVVRLNDAAGKMNSKIAMPFDQIALALVLQPWLTAGATQQIQCLGHEVIAILGRTHPAIRRHVP